MNSSMNVIYFEFMFIAQNNFEEIEKTKQVKRKQHHRHKGINITHHIKAQTLFNLRRGSLLNAFGRVVNKSRIRLCCDDDFFKHILGANTRKEIKAQKATAHEQRYLWDFHARSVVPFHPIRLCGTSSGPCINMLYYAVTPNTITCQQDGGSRVGTR